MALLCLNISKFALNGKSTLCRNKLLSGNYSVTRCCRQVVYIGLQRNYQAASGSQIYVWRDNCLQFNGVTQDFLYTSPNYSSWKWAGGVNQPFGPSLGSNDNENFVFTTHYSYGPWDDYAYGQPYGANVGTACRKGKSFLTYSFFA